MPAVRDLRRRAQLTQTRVRGPARRARGNHPQLGAGQACAARTGAGAARGHRPCAGNGIRGAGDRNRPAERHVGVRTRSGCIPDALERMGAGSLPKRVIGRRETSCCRRGQWRKDSGDRAGHMGIARPRLRRHRRAGAEARLSSHRHRADVRERTRGRRGPARLGRQARSRCSSPPRSGPRISRRTIWSVDQGKPGAVAADRGRPVAAALAQPAGAAGGDARRAGAGQAAGARAAYRRVQFHRGADRGGGGCVSRAAGVRSGRVPSLSRPDQGEGRLRAPWHGAGGL